MKEQEILASPPPTSPPPWLGILHAKLNACYFGLWTKLIKIKKKTSQIKFCLLKTKDNEMKHPF